MAITADYHLHSRHSGDSDTPMELQVRSALEKGLSQICFTEHYDPDFPYFNTPDLPDGYFELDLNAYREEFLNLREKYRGRIDLYFGIELGLQPHLHDLLTEYLRINREFDFVIGSTHVCDNMDPYYPAFFEGRTEHEALCSYFRHSLECLKAFHDIDTYAHMDYVVRYLRNMDADYRYFDYSELIDPILKFLTEHDIALEINTSALKKGCREFNPSIDTVRRYVALGGEMITIGSDAHIPDAIAFDFEKAARLLRDIGLNYYTVFQNRSPVMKKL